MNKNRFLHSFSPFTLPPISRLLGAERRKHRILAEITEEKDLRTDKSRKDAQVFSLIDLFKPPSPRTAHESVKR